MADQRDPVPGPDIQFVEAGGLSTGEVGDPGVGQRTLAGRGLGRSS